MMVADSLIRMILVLILGLHPETDVERSPPSLRDLGPRQAAAFVQLDMGAARNTIIADPVFWKILFNGEKPEQIRQDALAKCAEILGAQTDVLKSAVAEIRSVGVWLLGFGKDDNNLRALAIVDRGNASAVLEKLLIKASDQLGFVTLQYAGAKIYAPGDKRRHPFWMTEVDGKIAVATDLPAIQSFLLRWKALASEKLTAEAMEGIGRIEVDGPAILNGILCMMRIHDKDEFVPVSFLSDLAAWREAIAILKQDGLDVRIGMDPNSQAAKILAPAPAELSAVLAGVPANASIALAIGIKEPAELWNHIATGFRQIETMNRGSEHVDEWKKEFRRESGLDLETDIVSNVTAAAWVVPNLRKDQELENQFVLIFQTRDAARAESSLRVLAARQGESETLPTAREGIKIWRTDELQIALRGKTVILAPVFRETSELETILKRLEETDVKPADFLKPFPNATAYGTIDLSKLTGGKNPLPVTAALSFQGNQLRAMAKCRLTDVVASALEGIVTPARAQANRVLSMGNLRQIAKACIMFELDHAKLPAGFEDLKPYVGDGRILTAPVSRQQYIYNKAVAGKSTKDLPAAKTPLAWDPIGEYPDGGNVVYADGHVQWVPREQFLKVIASATDLPRGSPSTLKPVAGP